jgi:phage baseplate assembly protein V
MNAFQKILAPIKLKIMMIIGRAIVAAIDDSNNTQLLQLKLLADELATNVERFENYGFSSYPLTDSQALAAFINGNRNHGIVLCVHDRRYRPSYLSSGEVSFYTYEDKSGTHRIHFKSGQIINIQCVSLDNDVSGNQTDDIGGNLTVTIGGDSSEQITGSKTIQAASIQMTSTSGAITINAATSANITAPAITATGTIVLNGQTTIGGSAGSGKSLATEDIIAIFNNHTHNENGDGGGVTDPPNSTLSSSQMTSNSKGN